MQKKKSHPSARRPRSRSAAARPHQHGASQAHLRNQMSSKKDPTKEWGKPAPEDSSTLNGWGVDVSATGLNVASDANSLVGGSVTVGNAGVSAGINTTDGIHGGAEAQAFSGSVHVGDEKDPAHVSVSAQVLAAEAEAHAGSTGVGASVGATLGNVGVDAQAGQSGAHTSTDFSLTGGVVAGAGGGGKFELSVGNDPDGDGIANYGFSLGLQALLGANIGFNVEQPGQQLASLFDGFFGTSFSSLKPDAPTTVEPSGTQISGGIADFLGISTPTAAPVAQPIHRPTYSPNLSQSTGHHPPSISTASLAAQQFGGPGGEFDMSPAPVTVAAPAPVTVAAPVAAPTPAHVVQANQNSDYDREPSGISTAQQAANEYAGGDVSGGEFGGTPTTSSSSNSSSSGGCFLTTAACGHKGLADDCAELTTLRWFRDNVMLASEAGREKVKVYYRIAPAIVQAIQAGGNAAEVWEQIWGAWILPSVAAVDRGDYDAADAIYSAMVEDLRVRFANTSADREDAPIAEAEQASWAAMAGPFRRSDPMGAASRITRPARAMRGRLGKRGRRRAIEQPHELTSSLSSRCRPRGGSAAARLSGRALHSIRAPVRRL